MPQGAALFVCAAMTSGVSIADFRNSFRLTPRKPGIEGASDAYRRLCWTVIDQEHHDFDTARAGWNGMIDRKPELIARCSSAEDVSAAVRHAARHGLHAVARCGGHSVSGASLRENSILIDLGGLKQIDVDPEARDSARWRRRVAGRTGCGDPGPRTRGNSRRGAGNRRRWADTGRRNWFSCPQAGFDDRQSDRSTGRSG